MSDLDVIVKALRDEVEVWLEMPTARPGQPAYLFPSLLIALAERIEANQ